MSAEHEQVLVLGLLQRPSRLAEVEAIEPDEFLVEEVPRYLLKLARRYAASRRGRNALDLALARTILERHRSRSAKEALAVVEECAGLPAITDAEFRDAVSEVASSRRTRILRSRGAESLEAAIGGDQREAIRSLRRALVEVEDADPDEERPVDVRSAGAIALERAALDAPSRSGDAFDLGFPRLMKAASFRRRQLTVVAGYTSDGKSGLSKAFALNASRSGGSVLFVALEMGRREMVVLLVAQHAATIDPRGLPYRGILEGTASEPERKLYRRALDDLEIREGGDEAEVRSRAGSLFVWAPRQQVTLASLENRVRAMKADGALDVVIVDYLELLDPGKSTTGQYRLDLSRMCARSKSLAREADVLLILNHQISRSGRDTAEKRSPPHYLLRDLGESSGVEKAADHVVWILSDEELRDAREARVGLAKARLGRTIPLGFHVLADMERAIVAPLDDEVVGSPG